MGCCQCVYFQSAGPFKLARSLYNYINKEKKRAKSALPSGQMPSMPDYQFSPRWDESQHI